MTVPAAARTLDLIEAFARERRPMTVSALAKATGMPVSSCHGLVKTLQDRGYLLEVAAQGGYYFTKALAHRATDIGAYDPLPSWVVPALVAIRDRCNETVLLAKLVHSVAVYVEVLESAQSVRYIAKVGDRRPLYASAVGKALLASVPDARRATIIDGLRFVKRSSHTLASKSAVVSDIRRGLDRGWFMTRGEYLEDVTAVAVPFMLGGEHFACGIAGPSNRMESKTAAYVKLIERFARHRR
jgi:IclR family acetate operon transcriptional repressor